MPPSWRPFSTCRPRSSFFASFPPFRRKFHLNTCCLFYPSQHVPKHLKESDLSTQKLEFYVQLHFATCPFRPAFLREMAKRGDARKAAGAAAAAMLTFRKYLENRGKTLSSTPEFLQYYALPYVPNPTEHPSFKQIFKAKWPKDIRMRLERFLDVILDVKKNFCPSS